MPWRGDDKCQRRWPAAGFSTGANICSNPKLTELDIAALVRALAEQQTALLAAHAESMRVQRVLIERPTNAGTAVSPPERAPGDMSGTASTTAED